MSAKRACAESTDSQPQDRVKRVKCHAVESALV